MTARQFRETTDQFTQSWAGAGAGAGAVDYQVLAAKVLELLADAPVVEAD